MVSLSKSSVLEYARFYGIASDFAAIDPLAYIDDTCKTPTPEPQPSPVIEQLQNAQQAITQTLLKEKLDIKKAGARLLSTVIRNAVARTEDINWADVLPAFDRIERLQVETPIFPAEYDTNTMLARGKSRYEECDIQLEPLEEPPSATILPSRFPDLIDDAMDQITTEKLSCSKDALKLIQHAKIRTDPSKKAVEDLLIDELTPCQNDLVFSEPSPLILSDADDAYFKSPSPVAGLQMLPSPTSPHCLPDHSTQRSQSGTLKDRECDRSQDPRINMLSCLFSDYDQDISGFVELEDDLEESLGCSNLRETSSSSQTSPDFDQNSGINTQAVPDPSTRTDIRVPSVSGSALDIDARSCASFNRLSRADSPPSKNVSETHIDAVTSTGGTPFVSATKGISTKGEKDCSKTTEYLICEQTGDNKIFSSSTGHFSYPIDESIIVSDAVHAISPLRPSQEVQKMETNAEEPFLNNMEQKPRSQGMCLQSKYKGFPNHESLLPSKRERSTSRESTQLKNRQISQRQKSREERTLGLKAHLPLSASLGSLSSFMEIRGRIKSGRPVVAISQYFAAPQPIDKVEHRVSVNTDSIMLIPATLADRAPQIQRRVSQQSYLYVSTALLKTHLGLIQCIERTQSALAIVYRDYGTTVGESRSEYSSITIALQPDTRYTLPNEADIIVSPTTGVILTTSQAITQLYLPGHKPKNPKITDSRWINSPLREQIFLLAPRYEHLYLLVSQAAFSRKGSQEGNIGLTWTADKRTLASFASLLAFCTSISDCAIVPLWVPSSPEALGKWILSICDKHVVDLPRSDFLAPLQTEFTPMNPSQGPRTEHGSMEETNWEHFLRRAGLNPYAAQAVLSILNKEERIMKAEGDGSSHKQGKFGSLSIFMAMSFERRQELFGKLIGEKLIGRVSLMIEKDWQCDWALHFNESAEL